MEIKFFARAAASLAVGVVLQAGSVGAQTPTKKSREPLIQYANRRFKPAKVAVSTGEPLVIRIVNRSHERIEFESFKLHREKVIGPGETIVVRLPALKPGTYDFFDDFHEAVPDGEIVASSAHP